ncbi:tRNA uridine-5-carboxymethylaminomethyl(34) synthesis GTPase MnmE [Betaproteobacteria bacterium]|nr:tRNA uridine-5-carboxymethylaminomethyl(34) synthesis GTPase MnmE [Betaproteobacteria bacterium]
MSALDNDTIVALSSAPIASALAIFRVSGPSTKRILKHIVGFVPKDRVSTLANFKSSNNRVFDKGLVVFFQAPKSFTGEDSCEFQIHGGLGVIKILMDTCISQSFPGKIVRYAEPGEFSKRAYINGKICLHEAEAISDLVNAESEEKVNAINRIINEGFGKDIISLANFIIKLRAELEAHLDFSADETGSFDMKNFVKAIEKKQIWLKRTIASAQKGKSLSHKLSITIIGNANAGKSTLLNRLSDRNVSIVHKDAGTTRDIILSAINMGNLQVDFFDTAGIRETTNEIEAEGINRALSQAKNSDLVLFCVDINNFNEHNLLEAKGLVNSVKIPEDKVLFVFTKLDLSCDNKILKNNAHFIENKVAVSAKTGEGILNLRKVLLEHFQLKDSKENDTEIIFLRKRSIHNLIECELRLQTCVENAKSFSLDLAAEDLRLAQTLLLEITGKISNEVVLEEIFSRFCIGK